MSDQPNQEKLEILGIAALAAACLFWSGNFIAGRMVSGAIDPLELNLIRWIISFLILLPLVAKGMVVHRQVLYQHKLWLFYLGLFGVAGFNGLIYQALTLTTVVNALLVMAVYPVVAVVVGAVLNGYRPTKKQILGSAISLFGAAFLILVGPFRGKPDTNFTEGMLWVIGGVLSWLIYSQLLTKRPKELPQNVVLGASVVYGILIMVPVLLIKGIGTIEFTTTSLSALLYISLFASVGGFLCWSFGVAELGPERAGQFIHLMPLFGTVLAITILGERLEWVHFVGAICIVLGIFFVNKKSK